KMEFADNSNFHNIAGQHFDMGVSIGQIPGVIAFQIPEAALLFNQDTDELYRFVFAGFYNENGLRTNLEYLVNVPHRFGESTRLPGEEGDTVTWMAEARPDPDEPPKSSE